MSNPFKTKEKQALSSVFQTAHLQEMQENAVMNRLPEQMQETNHTAQYSGQTKHSAPFGKAKKEAASPQQNLSPVTESIYRLDQSSVRSNYSDERLDFFHTNVCENIQGDLLEIPTLREWKKEAALLIPNQMMKAYQSVLDEINIYAQMDPMKTSRQKQAKALQHAQQAIKSFLNKYDNRQDQRDEDVLLPVYRIRKYENFFAITTNGYLAEKPKEPGIHMRATTKKDAPALYKDSDFTIRYADRSDDPLFPHEPSMNDIEQLGLGDCYLQAAVSSLVMNHPQQLKECMTENADKTVTVRFYKKWKNLNVDEQAEYIFARQSEEFQRLWNDPFDYHELKDNSENLILKLLQQCDLKHEIGAFVRKNFETEKNNQIIKIQSDQNLDANEQTQYIIDLEMNHANLTDMMDQYSSKTYADDTKALAAYLANQPVVRQQVIENMDRLFSQKDADPDLILKQSLLRLLSLMPFQDPNSPLNTPEFQDLIRKKGENMPENDTPIPVYVTVTKEVPVKNVGADAYTNNCLWMQVLEKAYAASGLHNNGKFKEREKEYQKEEESLRERLKNKKVSDDEIQKQVNALKKQHEKQLRQFTHSYESIIGGRSSAFLETLTGNQAVVYDYSTTGIRKPIKHVAEIQNRLDNALSTLLSADARWNIPSKLGPLFSNIAEHFANRLREQLPKIDGQSLDVKPFYIEDIEMLLESFDVNHLSPNLYGVIDTHIKLLHILFEQSPELIPGGVPKDMDLQTYLNQTYTIPEFLSIIKENLPKILHNETTILHRPFSGQYTPFAENLYQEFRQALDEKKIINIGTEKFLPDGIKATGLNGESEQGGLVETHAYSVVDVVEKDGHRFVQLRNPWASGELGYQKTTDPNGKEMVSSRRIEAKTNGHFYMEWNDFLSKIAHVDINQI